MKKPEPDDAPEPRVVEPKPGHPARRPDELAKAEGADKPSPLLPAVAPIPRRGRCPYTGIGRNRTYDLAKHHDPDIIIRMGGRSVVDVTRIIALVKSMPRGPRQPNGGKGRKRRS